MASSEVSEVFTSSFEDERTLNQLAADPVTDHDLYGSEELIVSSVSEDVPQSEEIVGAGSINDPLSDVYVPTTSDDHDAIMTAREVSFLKGWKVEILET